MNFSVDCSFISGSGNTSTSDCLKWLAGRPGEEDFSLVTFGIHHLVAICCVDEDKRNARVVATLRGHVGLVIGLSYEHLEDASTEVYSCGADGMVRVWRREKGKKVFEWAASQALDGMTSACVAISSVSTAKGVVLSASDSSGKVMVWSRMHNRSQFELVHTVTMPPSQTPHVLHLVRLDDNDAISLLIGAVDSKIHVLTCSEPYASPSPFKSCGALTGHDEWVTSLSSRQLDSRTTNNRGFLLASGSKDFKTRVWRFERETRGVGVAEATRIQPDAEEEDGAEDDGESIVEEADAAKISLVESEEESRTSEARLHFTVSPLMSDSSRCTPALSFSVYLETLLVGHEDWVTSVQWLPDSMVAPLAGENAPLQGPQGRRCYLFTTSMDRNMILWTGYANAPSEESEGSGNRGGAAMVSPAVAQVWTPVSRVGDVGGMLGGSVGANLLGFAGACLSPDGKALLGLGYGGSFHLYCFHPSPPPSDQAALHQAHASVYERRSSPLAPTARQWRWLAKPFATGHFSSVNSLCWSEDGHFFITASSDETSRVWAPVESTWRELSRPQVHGYHLNCVALVGSSSTGSRDVNDKHKSQSSYQLYSAGDEKVVRVYAPTGEVMRGIQKLAGLEIKPGVDLAASEPSLAARAYIPELKLSTKPVSQISEEEQREMLARGVHALDWAQPPLESQLSDLTVWLEEHLLFGHTNDIMCLDITQTPDKGGKRWMATACKARNADTAAILLWDLAHPRGPSVVARLPGHESTVTSVQFSPCGRYLASAGKDRSLSVHRANSNGDTDEPFELFSCQRGVHKRIVWDLSWLPSYDADGNCKLLTASRDGTCKLWNVRAVVEEGENPLECLHTFTPFDKAAVTAATCAPLRRDGAETVLALGSERGDLCFWVYPPGGAAEPREVCCVPEWACHGAAVKCLRWRPGGNEIASCGEDHTVRLYKVLS